MFVLVILAAVAAVPDDPAPARDHLPPGEGNLGVDCPACRSPVRERGLRHCEPGVPGSGGTQTLPELASVVTP